MQKNKRNYTPFMKDFYRVSKERLKAYLETLDDANDVLKDIRPINSKEKVDWREIDEVWGIIIGVFNSLYGFKNYEDAEAGGEEIQDSWLSHSHLDDIEFYEIEFPKEEQVVNTVDNT